MALKQKSKTKSAMKREKVMNEFQSGELHSGSKQGPKVTNPKQAVAIAYSEAEKATGKSTSSKRGGKRLDTYSKK